MTTALRETPFQTSTARGSDGIADDVRGLEQLTWPAVASSEQAACLEVDPELFFAEMPADLELAKRVCVECPLREPCLVGALERREPHGVWGGEIFAEGQVIARKRPRGRPRKHPLPEWLAA